MESPFSFHCMICFEWFQAEKRYPVVLPCGHTYICNECAERLDKCMECRKPLYTIVNPHVANNSAQSNVLRRYQSNNVHQPKPQVPIKKRLPLPKNLVLMSLIEATELAAESVRAHQGQEPSLTESPKVSGPASSAVWDDDDDEQGEEEKIKASTSLAISDCGTYAVANGEGLEIFPSRPGSGNPKTKDEEQEEDVDTLVRFFHLEHKGDVSDKSVEQISQAQLCMGDRIQIVSIENGWAKLARGYGYVKADGRKLVKVGGSVDRACKLEAMLRLLSTRRKKLRTEQMRVDNNFITLMNELQASLMADEDLTVIAAHAFQENSEETFGAILSEDPCNNEDSAGYPLGSDVKENENNHEYDSPLKPRPTEPPASSSAPGEDSRSFFCSAPDVFGSIPSPSLLAQPFYNHSPLPSLPGPSDFLPPARNIQANHSASSTTIAVINDSNPQSNVLREGARAWREMHNRQESRNVGVDFRTGMSGHSGLLNNSGHKLGSRGRTLFSMSNHSGLSMSKSRRVYDDDSSLPENSITTSPRSPQSHNYYL